MGGSGGWAFGFGGAFRGVCGGPWPGGGWPGCLSLLGRWRESRSLRQTLITAWGAGPLFPRPNFDPPPWSKGAPQEGHCGADFGSRSGPEASGERKGRHQVHYGFYQLRSTWATPIGARNGSKTRPRRHIGLRLASASEKCPQRAPKGVPKWSQKFCKNVKLASWSPPGRSKGCQEAPDRLWEGLGGPLGRIRGRFWFLKLRD